MYEIIEKEFKKNNPYKKYRMICWIYFSTIYIISLAIHFIFDINSWILCIIMYFVLALSIYTYVKNELKTFFGKEKFKKNSLKKLLYVYVQNLNMITSDRLVKTLKENNINSKDKIKILINYYNRKEPVNTKTSIVELITNFFITIASIVVIAYNDVTGIIETNRFINVISFTFFIVVITGVLTLAIKLIFRSIFFPKEYFNSSLLEELTYIYMNYEEYEAKLNK